MDKPVTLIINDTTEKIIKDINESKLPACILIDILSKIAEQINQADAELVEQYIREQNMKQIKKDKKGSDK